VHARAAGLDVLVVDHRAGTLDKACGEGLLPGALRAVQQALAARLVEGTGPVVHDQHVKPGGARVHGRGQAHRPGTHHQDVHVRGGPAHAAHPGPGTACRSARSSAGMRNRASSTAFSTVNVRAVTQQVCTSGSAIPSTTTAT